MKAGKRAGKTAGKKTAARAGKAKRLRPAKPVRVTVSRAVRTVKKAVGMKVGPAMRPFRLPVQHEQKTSSGLSVIVAPRGPIPMAAIRLVIPGGSAVERAEEAGLADFTARLMRRGAAGMDADAINEAVEFVGGRLDVGASEDQIEFNISTPSAFIPEMLEVLGKLLSAPTFEEAELQSAKERTLARIVNDLDDPAAVAERALMHALWGDHPYGHEVAGTTTTVSRFTREAVVAFHQQHLGPRAAVLVVVGDVDADAVHRAAEKAFADWTGGPASVTPPAPRAIAHLSGKLMLVDKPDQTQSQVRIGAMTLLRTHPDYHATVVANCVLGAGFTSRLVNEIRVNRGLSYGVHSYLSPNWGGAAFGVDTFTKTSSTREILEVALAEVEKVRARGITAAELEKAKTYLCGLYPLRLETNESIAAGIADIRLSGLPTDWVQTYREKVQAVTRAQAGAAARNHLLADPPAVVVVGKADEVAPQLLGLFPMITQKVSDLG